MVRVVMLNRKGFTLVEVMIALLMLLLISLAMMQTALVSIDANMTNVLRDEAVHVAEQRMTTARNTSFDALTSDGADVPEDRKVRNATITYNTRLTATTLNTDNKQVRVDVRWAWKGQNYTHTTSTIVRKQ